MKIQNKFFTIDGGVYPYDFLISISQTDKQFEKALSLKGLIIPDDIRDDFFNIGAETLARTFFINGYVVIRLTKYLLTPRCKASIAHEIFHGVEFVFRQLPIPLTVDTSEAYAYYIGYVTREFYQKLNEK